MKILIDTNRIIAALVKESTTRSILMDETFQFVTPDFTLTEMNEHKEEIKIPTAPRGGVLAMIFNVANPAR